MTENPLEFNLLLSWVAAAVYPIINTPPLDRKEMFIPLPYSAPLSGFRAAD